eukprot:SAG31_NODE_13701_length_852_cov_1.406375_1_plen_81_part_10
MSVSHIPVLGQRAPVVPLRRELGQQQRAALGVVAVDGVLQEVEQVQVLGAGDHPPHVLLKRGGVGAERIARGATQRGERER